MLSDPHRRCYENLDVVISVNAPVASSTPFSSSETGAGRLPSQPSTLSTPSSSEQRSAVSTAIHTHSSSLNLPMRTSSVPGYPSGLWQSPINTRNAVSHFPSGMHIPCRHRRPCRGPRISQSAPAYSPKYRCTRYRPNTNRGLTWVENDSFRVAARIPLRSRTKAKPVYRTDIRGQSRTRAEKRGRR